MSASTRLRSRAAAVYLLVVLLAVAGGYELTKRPSSIFPPITFPVVKLIANVGDESAARMMPTVTRPLEEAILRVPGIQTVRSTTSRGSSEIDAIFAWGTDMQVALQRVEAEAQRVRPSLPSSTTLDTQWMNTATYPIEGYALTSQTRTQAELLALAEYTLKPALVRIPGVSQVQIQGGRRREFEVRLDRVALEGRQLSASDVVDAIKKDDVVLSAGLVEKNHELYLTLVDGRVHDITALEELAVSVPGGIPATLGQLGTVETADEISYVRTTADGKPAVLLNVIRQPSASTLSIASDIEQRVAKNPDLVPPDVTWTTFYDQARFVSASVSGTEDAILIGVALAVLVLLVFLRSLRLTLIAAAAIPLTIAIVVLGLAAVGETINLMTLSGIAAAIGLIADDAIVVVENIHRHEEEGHPDAVDAGVRQIRSALLASSLSTTVILVPFALLGGIVGAFFKPLALTMGATLAVSFFLAWLVVPISVDVLRWRREPGATRRWWRSLGRRLRESALGRGVGRVGRAASRGYGAVVAASVRRGWIAVVVVVGLLAGGWYLFRTLGTDFLPAMDEGSIILDYWTPPGTSLEDTNAIMDQVDRAIGETSGVASYSRRTGAQLGFFITEPNRGDYVIDLVARGKRRGVQAIIDELRTKISSLEPQVHIDFGQLLEDNLGDLSGGVAQPVDVKIFGQDEALLHQKAKHAADLLGGVQGVTDVSNGIVVAGPALVVAPLPEALARYGLTTTRLHADVAPSVVGDVVGQVRVGERMYDLRVLAQHHGPLTDLPIRTPSGALVHLGDLATVTTGAPETEIDRENLRSYVGVTARLSGRSLGGAMGDVRATMTTKLALPSSMSIEYGGAYAQQQSSFRQLLYVLVFALALVAVIVLFEFGEWRAAVVVVVVAAASLAGAFAALWVTGTTLNISSYVGAIMLVGIVGENGVFVVDEARRDLAACEDVALAWTRASRRRLRPVAMTIFATSLALAPIALDVGHGAQLMQPLAIAVIGGFLLAGPLVLVALPSIYGLFDPRGRLAPARRSERAR